MAQKIGADRARQVFGPIAGVYDMRVGDAHPTSSDIAAALELAQIDTKASYLRQGQQLIANYGKAIWTVGKFLFGSAEEQANSAPQKIWSSQHRRIHLAARELDDLRSQPATTAPGAPGGD
jgi:hypothetical protein